MKFKVVQKPSGSPAAGGKVSAALSGLAAAAAKRQPPPSGPVWTLWENGVTQGFLASFQLCKQKAELGYTQGLRKGKESGASSFGSFIHAMLEEFYASMERKVKSSSGKEWDRQQFGQAILKANLKGWDDRERKRIINDTNLGFENEAAFQQLEENQGLGVPLLEEYIPRWADDFEGVEWVELEGVFCFEWELADGRKLKVRGKRDGIRRNRQSGKLWLFETKTKGRIDEETIQDKLNFDLQVFLYSYSIFIERGEWPEGVIYNVMRKPGLKRKKEETLAAFSSRISADIKSRPDFYYMRWQNTFTRQDQEKWLVEFGAIMEEVARWDAERASPRNSAACTAGGFACDFLALCARGDKRGLTRRDTAFPELEE